MKKIFTIFICALMTASMIFALSACGGSNSSSADQSATEASQETASADGTAASSEDSDLAKIKDAGKIIVGITDFAPMDYKENGEWTGFDAELSRLVAKELDVEVEFMEIDWDNKILELNSGTVDCIWNGMTLTDEVKNSMDCTDPYIINEQVVVMDAANAANYTDAESMKDLTFAVEAGSAGANAAYDAGFENITEVDVQSKALMEVAAGTSDACVIDSTMAAAMTGEGTSYENLTVAAELTSEDYGIGFRQGSDLVSVVNDLIKGYAEDGTMKTLAEKYNLKLAE